MDEKTISFLSDVGPEVAAPVLAELNKAIAENKVRNPSAYVTKALANLPRPGGGYYGYLTAAPLTPSDKTKPYFCATANTTGCGVGLAQSDDGLHWTALESPGPNFGLG